MKFQVLTQPHCIGFLSQCKDFTNCVSILPFFSLCHNLHLKILSYSEPVALAISKQVFPLEPQGSAESHLFPSPFKSRSKGPPPLASAGWVSSCGWPEDELIPLSHRLAPSSSPCRTAPCWVKSGFPKHHFSVIYFHVQSRCTLFL